MALAVGGGAGRGDPQQRRVLRLRQGAAEHGQARQRAGLVGGGLAHTVPASIQPFTGCSLSPASLASFGRLRIKQ